VTAIEEKAQAYKGSAPEEPDDDTPIQVAKAAPKPAADTKKVSDILAKIKTKKIMAALKKPKKVDQSLINSGAEIVID
jgi:hypothetical protein